MARNHKSRPASSLELYRRARGLSRDQLAELAHVHPETVARTERGECVPHGLTLVSLAEALDVKAQALLPPCADAETEQEA
jgi:transcriptional regulator with XRE-family HTH domain